MKGPQNSINKYCAKEDAPHRLLLRRDKSESASGLTYDEERPRTWPKEQRRGKFMVFCDHPSVSL